MKHQNRPPFRIWRLQHRIKLAIRKCQPVTHLVCEMMKCKYHMRLDEVIYRETANN